MGQDQLVGVQGLRLENRLGRVLGTAGDAAQADEAAAIERVAHEGMPDVTVTVYRPRQSVSLDRDSGSFQKNADRVRRVVLPWTATRTRLHGCTSDTLTSYRSNV